MAKMGYKATVTAMAHNLFAIFCVIFLFGSIKAQDTKRVNVFPIPVVFSSPETGFAFGASLFASATLDTGTTKDRQSSSQLAFVYTTKKQILLYVPFQLYLNKSKMLHEGEIGYYRYNYPFYGVGIDAKKADRENYEVSYPRIVYNFFFQRNESTFIGPGFRGDVFNELKYEEGGLLEPRTIEGTQGGLFYALTANYKNDKRNDVFFPTKGLLYSSSVEFAAPFGASDYQGFGIRNDFTYYLPVFKQSVVAFNAGFEKYNKSYPFYQKALLGGTKRLRGLIAGRYRDNGAYYFQSEGRFSVFKKAYATAFIGIGSVFSETSEIANNALKVAVGAGFRYQLFKQNKLNARLDFGYGDGDLQFYLTFGEAF